MRTFLVVIGILALSLLPISQRTSAASDLSELAWLAGLWTGVKDGVESEESWLPPKGNTMMGVHRDVKNNRMTSYEFFRIEAGANGITYWASPRSKPPTPFRMIELSGKKVVFENPQHDFPQRIIYRLEDDALHAKIEGTFKGQAASEEWVWKRAEK